MPGDIPYRVLGRTGERISAIGLGGWHLALPHLDETLADRIIRTAVDRGITFLDNSWDYNEGESERRMGKVLRDGYRARVFLMTKIDGRSHAEATRQLDESLRRLQTECIDLVQHHEVIRFDDPHRLFDDDGANRALLDARTAGKLRYIGFTGHKDPHIHLHTLDVAREQGFDFDAVQMPLNVMDAHYRSFERLVLPRLTAEGIGVLGMKPMANGIILRIQHGVGPRVPEVRPALADVRRDYGHRLPRSARASVRRGRIVYADARGRGLGAAGQDRRGGGARRVRTFQDVVHL